MVIRSPVSSTAVMLLLYFLALSTRISNIKARTTVSTLVEDYVEAAPSSEVDTDEFQIIFKLQADFDRPPTAPNPILAKAVRHNIIESICRGEYTPFCLDRATCEVELKPWVRDYYTYAQLIEQAQAELDKYSSDDETTESDKNATSDEEYPEEATDSANIDKDTTEVNEKDASSQNARLVRRHAPRQVDQGSQASNNASMRARVTLHVPQRVTQGRDFAAVIATNLKQDAPNFDLGDGYSIDTSTIQVTKVSKTSTTSDVGSEISSIFLKAVAAVVMLITVAVVVMAALYGILHKRRATVRYTGEQRWNTHKTTGRDCKGTFEFQRSPSEWNA